MRLWEIRTERNYARHHSFLGCTRMKDCRSKLGSGTSNLGPRRAGISWEIPAFSAESGSPVGLDTPSECLSKKRTRNDRYTMYCAIPNGDKAVGTASAKCRMGISGSSSRFQV